MKTTTINLDDTLKKALASNDVAWLQAHKCEYDIDYRFKHDNNDTLLSYAMSNTDCNVYQYLLQNGADTFATNDEGETIFHSAVYSGQPERLDFLLRYAPEAIKLLNAPTNEKVTPLLLAATMGNYFMCSRLLSLGADVNMTDDMNNAPIHLACSAGNLDIVKILVQYGADLHIKTDHGNLPLALAINGGYNEIAKYLLSQTSIWKNGNLN